VRIKSLVFLGFLFGFINSCQWSTQKIKASALNNLNGQENTGVSLIVLGTLQDGGSPHAGCKKPCCKQLFNQPDTNRLVVSLGLIDYDHKSNYLFEATPDLPKQMKVLKRFSPFSEKEVPDAIFLTHAHIGHYTGLMYLGREVMGAKDVKVYALPKMKTYLETNGPWSQLVLLHNILLQPMQFEQTVQLNPNIKVTAFKVPHRDEYSETAGFLIEGPQKKALFIPDIDKWSKWNKNIIEEIGKVDYAFIDATFYDGNEMPGRDISEIPHPFVSETMQLLNTLSADEKKKIYFIHLNHTNPLLDENSAANLTLRKSGFNVATYKQRLPL